VTGTLTPESTVRTDSGKDDQRRDGGWNLGRAVGLCMALLGVFIGAQPLSDNSFLTHLATGRQMIADGFVRADVFTWTSQGRELVVQSWLASAIYGGLEEVGGYGALRLSVAATAGFLAWIAWNLSEKAAGIFARLVIMAPILAVGGVMWSERPLLIALALFALTLMVAEGRGRPLMLVGVGLVWVGVHGSWPLGLVLLAGRVVGARLDKADERRDVRCLSWLAAGIVFGGVVNPYGPRLLWFPMRLIGRRETLSHVAEWQSPSFDSLHTRAFLGMLLLLIFAVTRRHSWRTLGPAMLFVAAALVSQRNIPMAMVVSIPVLAMGLPSVGRLGTADTSRIINWIGYSLVAALLIFPLLIVRPPDIDFAKYPVEAVDAMEAAGLSPASVRVLHPDFVGNYLDLRYGGVGAAWIDDRYELHSASLMADYLTLFSAGPDWRDVLEHSGGDVLLWQSNEPVTQLVRDVAGWQQVWSGRRWTVLCRPDAPACRDVPTVG